MPGLTASQLVTLACQIARQPAYTAQAGQMLNTILAEFCQEYDFDAARQAFNFNFSGAIAPIGNLNVVSASGPFQLPADYLRAKLGDVVFFPSGLANLPIKLTPVDIDEFDGMLQQAGFQNYPCYWVTDMSVAQPIVTCVGNSVTNTIQALSPRVDTAGVVAGTGVSGPGIVPGTTVVNVQAGGLQVLLSQVPTRHVTGGSFFFGTPAVAYVWPPSSGAYPCLVRYYSQMPDIVTPETNSALPWFPNSQVLLQELSGRIMQLANDPRWEAFLSGNEEAHPSGSRVLLRRYLQMKDDKSNRAQRVSLDRRKFGTQWNQLPKSKSFGGF